MCKHSYSFIDLFAGIGGIRFAFEKFGGTCVFSSEYDKFAQLTYKAFFGEVPDFSDICPVEPPGDITKLPPELVPDHDILTAGFPCQPFSLAGVSKKQSLGRPHGFEDPTQGTLFFNIKEILSSKRPKAFLLENVKNLKVHDGGKTFSTILETLTSLGYDTFTNVIDASKWLPQHRERIYIVGFRNHHDSQTWRISDFPELYNLKTPRKRKDLTSVLEDVVPPRYTLGIGTWNTLKRHKAHHKSKGQGFGYGLIKQPFKGQTTRTLSARYHKDGAEILIHQRGKRPRRMTPLECCRIMGFPKRCEKYFKRDETMQQPVSDTQAYRQFGNSVVVPVVTSLARIMIQKLVEVGAI